MKHQSCNTHHRIVSTKLILQTPDKIQPQPQLLPHRGLHARSRMTQGDGRRGAGLHSPSESTWRKTACPTVSIVK
eukprot:1162558-Pyramimonas_sp.AAC.1